MIVGADDRAIDSSYPLVSVIIPAFNAERFITQAIESTLAQTYENIEVIVVDDGSDDRTPSIVGTYVAKDSRIRLFSQANLGVAAARNLAIGKARGDFIAPLDADDVWHPHKLERQVSVIMSAPEVVGVVYVWSRKVDRAGRPLVPCSGQTWDGTVFLPLLVGNFIGNSSSPLIRTECFRKLGGYDTAFREHDAQGCEDWELYLRVSESYQFKVIPECLVDYRRTDDSMSANTREMERSHEVLLNLTRIRHVDIPEFVYRLSKGSYFLYIANTSSRCAKADECLTYLWKAARHDRSMLVNGRFQRLLIKNLARKAGATSLLSRMKSWRTVHTGGRDSVSPAFTEAEDLLGRLTIRRRARLLRLQEQLNIPVVNDGRTASGRKKELF